jgi:cytochrome c-type biogenesis protein CcmE
MKRIPQVKFLVAGGLIIGTICLLMFSGIDDAMVYYYTVSEVQTQGDQLVGKGIRISGHVQPGSIRKSPDGTVVDFEVFEKATGEAISVTYSVLIPDTFKDDAEVVVEGIYDSQSPSFGATTLLAKCPSKYEGRGDQHPDQITVEKVSSEQ